MSTIDERAVAMRFQNSQFEQGIKESTKSLEGLKKGLNLEGAGKGLGALSKAANAFSLAGMANGVDQIASKFSALGIAGVTAIANIANRAVDAGITLARSLTVDPIKSGLQEYETNLNGIQTILASTKMKGETLKSVNTALQVLNEYSDQTIYNFGQMVNGIKTLTTTGADLQTSVDVVKGFANAAALAGVGAQEMASALQYGLNQAISKGKMMTQDWMSLETSGIASETFKNAIMDTARVNGVAVDKIIEKNGSFRDSLKDGWLTADILQQTLAKFTGEMTDAQLRQQGYSEQQIKNIQDIAREAVASATEVKTFSQLMGTLAEGVGSGWAQSFQIILGDLGEAKSLFTGVSNVLGNILGKQAEERNKLLTDWDAAGGRTAIMDAVVSGWEALLAVLKPIKEAFSEIFPPATGAQLAAISKSIASFMESLKIGAKDSENLKRTFRGVFAVLDIGRMVIMAVFDLFGKLFGGAQKAGGGFLEVTGNIGDFLVKVRDSIKDGNLITKVFEGIAKGIGAVVDWLRNVGKFFTETFDFSNVGEAFLSIGRAVKTAWEWMQPGIEWMGKAFDEVGKAVKDFFKTMDFNVLVGALNAGLLGGLIVIIKKFINGIPDLFGGMGNGIIDTIKGAFTSLTDTMEAMQGKLKAETLIRIAIAIGILTASVVALSFIETSRLYSSLGAIGAMFAMLMGAMTVMDKVMTSAGIKQMAGLTIGMLGLASAMGILAGAVTKMSKLSWDEIGRGLSAMAGALALMLGAIKLLGKQTGSFVSAAVGITILSGAMYILAGALGKFAEFNWEELARGGAAIAGAFAIIAGFSQIVGKMKGLAIGAVGIVIISGAMHVLAGAVEKFADISWDELGRGLVAMGGALAIIGIALAALPPSTLISAAALGVVALSLGLIADAMGKMGSMTWDEIGRGMVVLAGSLVILAAALYLMTASLPGAAALLVAAAALAVLTPVMQALGSMSWEEIGTGLGALAATLGILALGGIALIPALPGFLGFGLAMLMFGGGAALAGIGLTAFAAALTAVIAAGNMGMPMLKDLLDTLAASIPNMMTAFAEGIIEFAVTIAKGGKEFTEAATTLISSLLKGLRKNMPEIMNTFSGMMEKGLRRLEEDVPKFTTIGGRIIEKFLIAARARVPGISAAATALVITFIGEMQKNSNKIIDAAATFVINFLNGLAKTIRERGAEMRAAGRNVADAIVDGIVEGLQDGLNWVAEKARNLANAALNAAKRALGIASPSKEFRKVGEFVVQGFVKGMTGNSSQISAAYKMMKDLLADTIRNANAEIKKHQDAIKKLEKSRREDLAAIKDLEKEIAKRKKEGKDTEALEKRLKKLTQSRKEDAAAIKEHEKAIKQSRSEKEKASKALRKLQKDYDDDVRKLKNLANQVDKYTAKIAAAEQKLADLRKEKADYRKSISDSYKDLASIDGETKLEDYQTALKKRIQDTLNFTTKLAKLRALGLSDEMYKQLLEDGVDAIPFMDELLAKGKTGVDELNKMTGTLAEAANELARVTSDSLYNAGIETAKGVVEGLKKERKAIQDQMAAIAKGMLTTLKKLLGIKSPSREMAKIGKFTTQGLVKGLDQTTKNVARASGNVGEAMMGSLKKSISDVKSAVATNMNMDPTIRPVLDLSAIRKDSSLINGMLKGPTLDIDGTIRQANAAQSAYMSQQSSAGDLEARLAAGQKSVTFVQNNNSPKALSPAEIYRQTKNQVSKLEGALDK